MNRGLAIDYITHLRLSEKRSIREEMGFGERHAHESDAECDKRFLTYVANEGTVRTLESLVIEYLKRRT
jgi:hypothetical protein